MSHLVAARPGRDRGGASRDLGFHAACFRTLAAAPPRFREPGPPCAVTGGCDRQQRVRKRACAVRAAGGVTAGFGAGWVLTGLQL